jgi:hypothetical protein
MTWPTCKRCIAIATMRNPPPMGHAPTGDDEVFMTSTTCLRSRMRLTSHVRF